MITIDTDTRYDGEDYRAILGKGETEEAWIKFLQPLDSRLKSQQSHDSALNYMLEQEEDIILRKTTLESGTETPEYAD